MADAPAVLNWGCLTNFLCGPMRKVKTAATDERTPVVDADINGTAI
jgi:hypothetical protein